MGRSSWKHVLHRMILSVVCIMEGLAVDPIGHDVLDLIQGFNTTGAEPLYGLRYTTGPNNDTPALLLDETHRNIAVPSLLTQKALRFLLEGNDVTFIASIRQDVGDSGTILSFSSNTSRFLELESSGIRDELRIHYTHQQQVHVETFPYRLADGQWHKLAFTLSHDQISIFVDCNRIYQRLILAPDWTPPVNEHLTLFLGQRNGLHALFKGALQDVKIVTQINGYLLQCPYQDTGCSTCVNLQDLEQRVKEMTIMYKALTQKLTLAEERLSELGQCQCFKSCSLDNGTQIQEGEEWKKDICSTCRCLNGSVQCHHEGCPPTECDNPVYMDGECCPVCPTNCFYNGKYYDHGDEISPRVCVSCTCNNGRMVCEQQDIKKTCPELKCSKSDQIEIHGQCCPVCKGTDFCTLGHTCHSNASCVNLATRYACQCHEGFEGDGRDCQDINECQVTGGRHGHHCNTNTVCVNNIGSYRCDCMKGFNRLDTYECTDVDECQNEGEGHACHPSMHCVNIDGGYMCQCNSSDICHSNCVDKGIEYSNGSKWKSPLEACQECMCQHGEIDCLPLACPKLTCENVIQQPNECCPTCADSNPCLSLTIDIGGHDLSQTTCMHMGMSFSHGEEWRLEQDQCTSCQCRAGHICCTFNEACSTTYNLK